MYVVRFSKCVKPPTEDEHRSKTGASHECVRAGGRAPECVSLEGSDSRCGET